MTKIKEKKDKENRENTWEKEQIWHDVIFRCFHTPIIYDYPIPSKEDMSDMMKDVMDELRTEKVLPKSLMDHLSYICSSHADRYSSLVEYVSCDWKFGSEFFYGYGQLYRWRLEEYVKSSARVTKYMPRKLARYVPVLSEVIKRHIQKNFNQWKHR